MNKHSIKIYIKPTCTTCRRAVTILRAADHKFESVNYYETKLTKDALSKILNALDIQPSDILRKKEKIYKDLGLSKKKLTKAEVIDIVLKYPDLLERPIVVKGDKAVLARPVEKIEKILK